ncbi:MAG: hypothetical protein E7266_04385 [Lachnospiraceae bacterium]|nr:hypothetical protein [Lachnospiraceae bacterium]
MGNILKSTEIIGTSTLNKIIIEYNNETDIFEPALVENCMNPGTYKTYCVEIDSLQERDTVIVKSLKKIKEYSKEVWEHAVIREEEIVLEKPGKSKCDGNCQECQKCS